MSIRILLADDHPISRQGLGRLLQEEEDMNVVAQVGNGHAAVELARELKPDVVVMDISMPDLNGIEATRQIRRESPQTRVLGLSMHSARRFISEMFKAGAVGYLLKDSDIDELLKAIRLVADGQTYMGPMVTDVVVESVVQKPGQEHAGVFSVLTAREREVLQLIAEGHTTKQIALRLYISPKTVEAHRRKVMDKLDIDNVALLTKYAIQEGLTSPTS